MIHSSLFLKTNRGPLGFAGMLVALVALTASAQTSGSNGSHDPSRMLESEGKFYIYSTGGGGKSSPDGLVWTSESAPPWNRALLANNQGIWAPDGIYLNSQYYLYGSMWSDAKASAIILLTNPTLNPTSPNYKWTDPGVAAIEGPAGVTHSCIDPAPVLDKDGNLWVVWGGGYPFNSAENSIFVTRMDNKTGLPLTTDPGYKPPNSPGYAIEQGHKEGPYIHYRSGYYYLWWQTGGCCSGTSSTYTMHVARSAAITGPYTGDKTFFSSNSSLSIYGPGHMGIYSCGGVDVFTYHYYPNNGSVIGVNLLTWGSDGWPTNGGRVTSAVKICSTTGISTSKTNLNGVNKEKLLVYKTGDGFEVYIPVAGKSMTQELFDVQGKKIGALTTRVGWNRIPGKILVPGINVIRVFLGQRIATALIINSR